MCLPLGVSFGIVKVNWGKFSCGKSSCLLPGVQVGGSSQILNQVFPFPADSVLAVGFAGLK